MIIKRGAAANLALCIYFCPCNEQNTLQKIDVISSAKKISFIAVQKSMFKTMCVAVMNGPLFGWLDEIVWLARGLMTAPWLEHAWFWLCKLGRHALASCLLPARRSHLRSCLHIQERRKPSGVSKSIWMLNIFVKIVNYCDDWAKVHADDDDDVSRNVKKMKEDLDLLINADEWMGSRSAAGSWICCVLMRARHGRHRFTFFDCATTC